MDEAQPNWPLRAFDLVGPAPEGDPALASRQEALRKIGAGEPLNDGDRQALDAFRGRALTGAPPGPLGVLTVMGFVFDEAADLLRQVDSLAAVLAERFGIGRNGEALAWAALRTYAQHAEAAAMEEAVLFPRGAPIGPPHVRFHGSRVQAVSSEGYPIAGATLEARDATTNEPCTLYADAACTVAHEDRITAGADGMFPDLHAAPGTGVALILRDASGEILSSFGAHAAPEAR